MKRHRLFYTLLCATLFTACQKLDRELQTDIELRQIERSFNNLQSLLNGVYAELREGFLEIGNEAMMASTTDEAEFTSETSPVQLINQGGWNAFTNPADVWGSSFRAIRRANLFLETASPDKVNLDAFKLDPTTYQARYNDVGRWRYEARFLRAFFYFELVKRYGGVPLVTSTAVDGGNVNAIKRNTLQECFDFIVAECDSAANNLPVTYTNVDLGRVTKGAALALKSRALLYAASDLFNLPTWAGGNANRDLIALPAGDRAARWKAAADAAKAVIDLAGTGYALSTNYRTLFTAFNNPEIIFTRRNSASNAFERINFPIGFEGRSGNTPTQNLVDAYEVKVSSTVSVKFDWNNPEHAANPYANRDPRMAMTVVTNGASFSTVSGQSRNVETFTGGRDGLPIPNATRTGYYLRKYVNESVNLLNNNTVVHSWIYFRLAEMYLNYAEALNEYSPGHADIKRYLDLIRNRPGVAMPPVAPAPQPEMREVVRNERRVELAFEDHRAWDVRRWMIAPATLGAAIRAVNIDRNATTTTYAPVVLENRVFEPKMYLFPIPQSELFIAKGLVQNPVW